MSNAVRYDPLLVRYLARELDELLKGRAIAAAPLFAADLSAGLALGGGEQLRVDLHPTRGWFRTLPAPDQRGELEAICGGVLAPPDERLLRILITVGDRFRAEQRELVVELHTNQWNALLIGSDGRIQSVLRARQAGARPLFPGEVYRPPAPEPRYGAGEVERSDAEAHWAGVISAAPPGDRRGLLLGGFAWTGSANARWILGEDADPEAAFRRWWWLRSLPAARPALVDLPGGTLPYPLALRGLPARHFPSILAAMEAVAEAPAAPSADPRLAAAGALARRRLAAAERRIARLGAERAAAGEAERLQQMGDLLLGRLHLVPRGAERVTLEGWEGETIDVELDPQLSPAENAATYYDRAGRRRRAEEQLPKLVEEAEAEAERWRQAAAKIDAGEIPGWVADALRRQQERRAESDGTTTTLPYRLYRTSGGLEVRVGRSARDNDRLTFHESTPNDVWLHARSVPGSHVILRWRDPEGAPPARDLAEAAQLAAVFSRARTSGTVAVDWTRRKYIRKPRGAPAGAVIPQRVKTLFVEPDAAVVERLQVREE